VLGSSLVILLDRRLVDLDVLGLDNGLDLGNKVSMAETSQGMIVRAYPRLEPGQICRAEGVGLGNDWNEVDARAQALHDLDIEGLERVTGGADEVQAGVHTEVDLVLATRLLLLEHIRLMLIVEELDDGHPRVTVVDIVAEARGVDDGQAD
jgi:hypothetical protein